MTPERKKYLDGISVEERVIRDALRGMKREIRWAKTKIKYANQKSWHEFWHVYYIARQKVLIKALKKQLPAPMKEEIFYNVKVFSCPVCDSPLDVCVENYCFKCGQKLK